MGLLTLQSTFTTRKTLFPAFRLGQHKNRVCVDLTSKGALHRYKPTSFKSPKLGFPRSSAQHAEKAEKQRRRGRLRRCREVVQLQEHRA